MRQLHPVLWNKGAFLQPQHLQCQDLYLESQLGFLIEAVVGYSYGFYSLTIDDAKLAEGYFSLAEAAGRFRDGALFDLTAHRPDPLEIGEFPEGEDSILVSLAVPLHRGQERNVTVPGAGPEATRYRADLLPRNDETTGMNEQLIQIGTPNLTYLTPRNDHSGYSVLPAARLTRSGGKLQVDRTFSPPSVRISASPGLHSLVKEWAVMLATKSQELTKNRKLQGAYNPEPTASDIQNFWLLYTVNAYYPQLRHYLSEGSVHPAEAYTEALALAGALTAFSLEVDPTELPAYDHDDPGKCFRALGLVLRRLVERAIPRQYQVLTLNRVRGQRVWTTFLKDEYFQDTRFFLAVETEPQPGWVIPGEFVTGTVQVVAGSDVNNLVAGQVYGLPLSKPEGVARAIPVQAGYEYFQLDTSGPTWASIRQSRSLAVYFPVPPLPKGAREADRKEPGLELVIWFKNPA